ncbi:RNA polymerase II-associated [Spinellus fusiger]|nr:RNA polymerase II-associated [Spinellus fusiger]
MTSKNKFRSDYICRVRYRNTLPPLPFPPKLLDVPSLIDRHIPYQSSALVEKTPYSLAIDQNSSRSFDKTLIDYLNSMEENKEDVEKMVEELAEEDKILMTPPVDEQTSKQKSHFRGNVTWLRRSEYIAAETRTTVVRTEAMEHRFALSGLSATDRSKEYATHEGQIAGIEKTFQSHTMALHHPITKKKAKSIIPVLPDTTCWDNIYSVGQFNVDPADDERLAKRKANKDVKKRARPSVEDCTDRGVLRPVTHPNDVNDSYLIWYLPQTQGIERLKRQKTGEDIGKESVSYEFVRDYEYKNEHLLGQKHILLTLRDEGDGTKAYYSLLKTKMTLKKRRALSKKYQQYEDYEKPGRLVVDFQE